MSLSLIRFKEVGLSFPWNIKKKMVIGGGTASWTQIFSGISNIMNFNDLLSKSQIERCKIVVKGMNPLNLVERLPSLLNATTIYKKSWSYHVFVKFRGRKREWAKVCSTTAGLMVAWSTTPQALWTTFYLDFSIKN